MSEPGIVTVHDALQVLEDVGAKLTIWQKSLDERRTAAVAAFTKHLATMQVPFGVKYGEYAEAQADIAIDRWCQRRDEFSREIVSMFATESVCLAQHLGVAAELGQHIGLHLDDALRYLDAELRSAIRSITSQDRSTS